MSAPEGNHDTYPQSFSVGFDYPVIFTRSIFSPENGALADALDRKNENRRHRVMVYVDQGVRDAWADLDQQIKEYFHARSDTLELAAPPAAVPGGEAAKTGWDAVRDVMWTLGNMHLDRQSFVVAIGGGGMLDMLGFAASIVHRGLRLVRVPTTTLAQDDAGVGVKNGMDEHGQKNFVGTFAPPWAVINDSRFLTTLSDRDWIGGVAEAFKVAVIRDAAFFDLLCELAPRLVGRDLRAMERVVRRCAELHLDHIRTSGDPFEFGSARPLDFGHWLGHRLETLSGYEIGHGQGAAIGIALDSCYAAQAGHITSDECERILAGLEACGLPTWHDLLDRRDDAGLLEVLVGLEQFREHLGGRLTVTLPDGIGRGVEIHQMDAGVIERCIGDLRVRAGR